MVKRKTPGVFKRGGRYVVTWRDATGQACKKGVGTYDQARDLKRKLDQQAHDGEAHVPAREQVTLAAYALDLFGADRGRPPGRSLPGAKGRGPRRDEDRLPP
jgi:hypothetical protein